MTDDAETLIAQQSILDLLRDLEALPREIVQSLETTKIMHEDSPISYNPRFPNRCDCKDCYFARLIDTFIKGSFRLITADTEGTKH